MTAIINYDAGNLFSVVTSIEKLGEKTRIASRPDELDGADRIILPGVGAFNSGIRNLRESGIENRLRKEIDRGTPVLGICLGLQLFFERSEEGDLPGLGILPGKVVRFPDNIGLPVPHMGWNTVSFKSCPPVLEGIPEGSYFYFAHSYYPVPDDGNVQVGFTFYGVEFVSIVQAENVIGVQFHPEKSAHAGEMLLNNFLAMK